MRSKGQLSFDLMFAIIALIVMLQFMLVFASSLHEEEGKINVRNQLNSIALQAKTAVQACQIADTGPNPDDASVSLVVPRIHELGTSLGGARECTVSISSNSITVTHDMVDTGETVEVVVGLPEYFGTLTVNCGEELRIVC